ncbi:MAG: DNA polymerase Y family protein [Marinobacter sp.]|nr:DNA polymerase Y family protein [Marinobacter sp.]
MLWIYLHLPFLLLEHYGQSLPEPRPMATLQPGSQRILQANPDALALGVRAGQSLATATTLAPALLLINPMAGDHQRALEQQARRIYQLGDFISLYPPDGLLLQSDNLLRLYGGLQNLWQKLQQTLASQGITATLATGTTPGMARLLARAGLGACTDDTAALARQLADLPVMQADFPQQVTERLVRMGLRKLADLQALPGKELAQRLGPATLHGLQKLQGSRPDPQPRWHPPARFQHAMDLPQEAEQSAMLLFPLQRGYQLLEEELRWRQQAVEQIQLRLYFREHPTECLSLRTTTPEFRADTFMTLTRLRLERYALPAPAIRLAIRVNHFLPRDTATQATDLFQNTPPQQQAWQQLIARLQARLGENALHQLQLVADHRPEKAWQTTPPAAPAPTQPLSAPDLPRPLWLLPEPQTLTATPAAWLAGPERIQAGWWDGTQIQRDYYIARMTSGQVGWIFRDTQGDWYLHGWFA